LPAGGYFFLGSDAHPDLRGTRWCVVASASRSPRSMHRTCPTLDAVHASMRRTCRALDVIRAPNPHARSAQRLSGLHLLTRCKQCERPPNGSSGRRENGSMNHARWRTRRKRVLRRTLPPVIRDSIANHAIFQNARLNLARWRRTVSTPAHAPFAPRLRVGVFQRASVRIPHGGFRRSFTQ
jgi:hypothetical protein